MRPAYVLGSLSLPSPPPSGRPDDPEHPLTCLGLCGLHMEQKAAGTKGLLGKGYKLNLTLAICCDYFFLAHQTFSQSTELPSNFLKLFFHVYSHLFVEVAPLVCTVHVSTQFGKFISKQCIFSSIDFFLFCDAFKMFFCRSLGIGRIFCIFDSRCLSLKVTYCQSMN